MRTLPSSALLAIFVCPSAVAAELPDVRTVTVTGDAEIKAVPDEVVLTLGVEARNKDLTLTKQAHDRKVKEVISSLQECGAAAKDIQTDYINLEPDYDNNSSWRRNLVGYIERTTIVVTLRDISKFEKLLSAALQGGADTIHGIQFKTSQLRKHRDEARALAIRAAKEKATALAGELGQKIGKPRNIQEGHNTFWSNYGSWWGRGYQGMSQNVMQLAPGGNTETEGTLSPGMLSIQASVSVTFELE